MSQTMFSPFSCFQRSGVDTALGLINSDGSSGSETSADTRAGAMAGYSPFMGTPWGNSLYTASDAQGPPTLELPNSPMSPGLVFNPSPSGNLPTPTSPRSMFQAQSGAFGSLSAGLRTPSGSLHLPSGLNNNAANAAAAAAAADAAAAAAFNGLPQFYFNAAAAAAAAAAAGGPNHLAALNQTLLNQHTATLAAAAQHQQQQQHQQLLQAALSASFANQAAAHPLLQGYNPNLLSAALEPMRSAGGSLSLDGGLQQQASVNAAAALIQQQHQQQLAAAMAAQHQHQASHLRRNMSTPAGVAAQLGLSSAAAAAGGALGLGASGLTSAGSGLLGAHSMGRLHVTHSADLSHLDAGLLGTGSAGLNSRPKFNKSRKNSEPKIGPDGQPRLNARQRRTLRRAKERALKGLLEVSQALLQKAEVQVTVPNISHLTALEELAAVEAEKEANAAANNEAGDGHCLSPSSASGRNSGSGGRSGQGHGPQKVTRSQQLAAAAAAVEESVCEIARAAVAAVTAQATGKDTASAAAAAQAAAANAASAAASAGAVLPPGYVMPETEEAGSEELQGCNSDPIDRLAQSAPTSPVGSNLTVDPSSGRSSSSSSSNSSLPGSARCSSSSTGSVASSYGVAGKPPMCHPPRPASTAAGPGSSPMCSPLPSPTPSCGNASLPTPKGASQLEGIDIAGLIGQLSLKKDEGMVDDKLIRDLQIIQSLIGALKSPASASGLDASGNNGPCGPSSAASPVPGNRTMRGPGSRSLPKNRCNSPIATVPLHSL